MGSEIKKYAGDVLSPVVPTAKPTEESDKVLKRLMHQKNLAEIDYIYILDELNQCVGFVTLQQLFHAEKPFTMEDRMNPNVVSVSESSSLRQAVHMALEHKLHDIPVTKDDGTFLGIIRSRDVLTTTYQELTSDLFKRSGIQHASAAYDDILTLPILRSVRHRLPWLLFGVVGGLFSTVIVDQFEGTLEKTVLLAAFIPLVVYIADAVGTQVEAYAIRDLTRFETPPFIYAIRQIWIVCILALIIGVFVTVGSWALYGSEAVAMTVGLTMIGAILSSVATGLGIPYFFRKMGQDPANASGPVATIIQDIMSIMIFFIIASLLI